jgi:2',3'-cyclic-nucleotide 2'-phosphodiesterase (5'-nucleotidase family)
MNSGPFYKVLQRVIHLFFFLLFIAGCRSTIHVKQNTLPPYSIGLSGNVTSDSSAEKLISPYREPLIKTMSEVVAVIDTPALKGLPESSLGNLICDLLLENARLKSGGQVDFCFLNTGGLRVEWPKGAISRSMVFELMPFENQLQIASFTGEHVLNLLKQIAERGGGPVAGVQLEIQNTKLIKARINNQEIDPQHMYTVVSSDYLLNGGDKFIIPAPVHVVPLNCLLRDALLERFKVISQTGQTLKPRKDGRIIERVAP